MSEISGEPARSGANVRRKPTMQEIAAQLGVHKSTVSRVLSNKASTKASPATAEAIRRLAREVGYNVDPWAASLRTRRTQTLGVLLPRLTDVVLAAIFEAIEAAAGDRGYQVLVASTADDAGEQRRRISLFESRRVDGLIITTGHRGDEAYLDELARGGTPFVLANRPVGTHPVVRGDDWDGGHQATRHLIAEGHRRIGVAAGPDYAPTGADRARGYRDALTDAGIGIDPELIVASGIDVEGGEEAARRLLSLSPRPTAIFAINDFMAVGVMSVIRDAGLEVGRDIAVVGYNDIPLAARLPVPLSSVSHPVEEIGTRAVELLLDLLAGRSPESVTLPVGLRVRASSQKRSR
jgi:LacI family transcriptional regulator